MVSLPVWKRSPLSRSVFLSCCTEVLAKFALISDISWVRFLTSSNGYGTYHRHLPADPCTLPKLPLSPLGPPLQRGRLNPFQSISFFVSSVPPEFQAHHSVRPGRRIHVHSPAAAFLAVFEISFPALLLTLAVVGEAYLLVRAKMKKRKWVALECGGQLTRPTRYHVIGNGSCLS